MPLLTPQQYVRAREAYSYEAPDCAFSIVQTESLTRVGKYDGIFAAHLRCHDGVNLRGFELICQEVFADCSDALRRGMFTHSHLINLQQVSAAIVHWKMASQGGRPLYRAKNMLNKWNDSTALQLIRAYGNQDLSDFRIGGVRIATATAFMRFLFPDDFGIMDSRVVGNHTQPEGITTLSVRTDGWIYDTLGNVRKYGKEYVPFLRREANRLNAQGITFQDVDPVGRHFASAFRPCDIEMALFQRGKAPRCAQG